MGVPVPFGQYVPGTSVLHSMEARAKLGLTLAFTFALFTVDGFIGLGVAAAATVFAVAVSGVPTRLVLRGIRPVIWLLMFTVALNALRWMPEGAAVGIGPLGVDGPGLTRGIFFAVRIVLLVAGTSLVTLTTSPVALTDALTRMMRPLKVVRFPVDDVAMMLTIALRFMPLTAEEAERIVVAQTARGARFDEGGAVRRARAWIPVLVPLFVNLFRRADTLALAMEARCYRGEGRTSLRESVMRSSDKVALVVGMTLALAVGILL